MRLFARKYIALFGSTHICEQTFPKMNQTKSRTRSRLTHDPLRALLRSTQTKLDIDITELARKVQIRRTEVRPPAGQLIQLFGPWGNKFADPWPSLEKQS